MTDDPKTAPPEGKTGSATATESPKTGVGDAGETEAQKLARLEKERDEAKKQVEDERALRLRQETRAREAERAIEDARRAVTPPTPTDPLDQRIAALEQEQAAYASQGVRSPSTEWALDQARAVKAAEQEAQRRRDWVKRLEDEFAAMKANPATAPYADRAKALFQQGGYATSDAALATAKAEAAPDVKTQLEELKKKNEELSKDLAASKEGRKSAGGAPVFSFEQPKSPTEKIRLRRADWTNLESQPAHKQRELLAAYNAGRIEFID